MADGFAGDTAGRDEDSASLLEPKVTTGLATAADYVGAPRDAFPDVAAGTGLRRATDRPAHAHAT